VTIAAGLVMALAATLALQGGFLLQHGQAARLPAIDVRRPLAALAGFVRCGRWLLGFGTGIAGWALYVGALTLAPLALVQTLAASGVAFMAVAAAATGARLPRHEWIGVALVTAGLALLGLSLAGASAPVHDHVAAARLAPAAIVAIAAAALLLVAARRGVLAAAGAGGLAAGILYGSGDVATKALLVALPAHPGTAAVLSSPYLWATLVLHTAAFWTLQRAFQLGGAVASIGTMTAATNLIPIAAAIVVLGEPLPGSPAFAAARVTAFALTVAGATLLAGRTE
jgi:hypothetical protein